MQIYCILLQYIFGLFYQEKDADFLHGKKIVTAYEIKVQQIFTDFTAHRISASSLKAVNYLSILTLEEFLHLD